MPPARPHPRVRLLDSIEARWNEKHPDDADLWRAERAKYPLEAADGAKADREFWCDNTLAILKRETTVDLLNYAWWLGVSGEFRKLRALG